MQSIWGLCQDYIDWDIYLLDWGKDNCLRLIREKWTQVISNFFLTLWVNMYVILFMLVKWKLTYHELIPCKSFKSCWCAILVFHSCSSISTTTKIIEAQIKRTLLGWILTGLKWTEQRDYYCSTCSLMRNKFGSIMPSRFEGLICYCNSTCLSRLLHILFIIWSYLSPILFFPSLAL